MTTTNRGPLTAATDSRSAHGAIRSRTASAVSHTDIIPPRPDRATNAALRSATTFAASARDRAPLTQAAAISPWEWPMTAAGSTPCARQSRARATITVNSTGCVRSTRSSPAPSSSVPPEESTSSTDQPRCSANASEQAWTSARNTGDEASRSAAMPIHCDPWPGKTNTGLGAGTVRPRTMPGAFPPSITRSSAARASDRFATTTPARWSSLARPAERAWPRAARGMSS